MLNVLAANCDAPRQNPHRLEIPTHCVNRQSRLTGVTATVRMGTPSRSLITRDVDVVSLHRPYSTSSLELARWLRRERPGVGLTVQLDENVMTPQLWRTVALADTVIVPESSIMAILPKTHDPEKYRVVHDAVPASDLSDVEHSLRSRWRHRDITRPVYIGWTRQDISLDKLDVVRDSIKTYVDGDTVRFRVIGQGRGVADALDLLPAHVESSGCQALMQRRVSMSELDIAVLPMSDTLQNRLTARRRVLELTAAGVPVIASQLPELVELRKSGCPVWLVENDVSAWSSAVSLMLAMSWIEIKKLAESHREYVRRYATLEPSVGSWSTAWIAARRAAVRRASRAVW